MHPDHTVSRATTRPRAVRTGALFLLVTAVAVGLFATPAIAHDELVSTNPADGATVDTAPAEVVLEFAEPPVALGSEVQVLGPGGANVSAGAVVLDGSSVRQPLQAERPSGQYRVQWRVTADDGHTVTGEFAFTATAGAGGPTATSASTSSDPTTSAATPSASAPALPPADTVAPSTPRGTADDDGVSGLTMLLAGGGLVVALGGAALVIGGIRRRRGASTS